MNMEFKKKNNKIFKNIARNCSKYYVFKQLSAEYRFNYKYSSSYDKMTKSEIYYKLYGNLLQY